MLTAAGEKGELLANDHDHYETNTMRRGAGYVGVGGSLSFPSCGHNILSIRLERLEYAGLEM